MQTNDLFYTKLSSMLKESPSGTFESNMQKMLLSFCEHPWFLAPNLPSLYFAGKFRFEPANKFRIPNLPCYTLWYTQSGNGILSRNRQSYFLNRNSLTFLDMENGWEFQASASGWEICFFCLHREEVAGYYASVFTGDPLLLALPVSSDIYGYMDRLLGNTPIRDMRQAISAAKWITNILSEFTLTLLTEAVISVSVPEYLQDMKRILDQSFEVPYKLEDFERRFMIPKTRICREFSKYYHIPPLQYLNRLRMNKAKDLLITTNMPIYEIGHAVGIENTNHFIHLFKKNTGVTPLVFRQSTPDSIRQLHDSSDSFRI